MIQSPGPVSGEFKRIFDERYRIALPPEAASLIAGESETCVLAKEQVGCLSLWNAEFWKQKVDERVGLVRHKLEVNALLPADLFKYQRFSRLLSARSREVKLGGRWRLLVPEGFREFLGVEPNNEVIILGAGVCLEIWNPQAWQAYLQKDMGNFPDLFRELVT